MERLDVVLVEPAWPELMDKPVIQAKATGVSCLEDATNEGKPVVIIRVDLEDGTTVLAQTTWRLFEMAYHALRGKLGSAT